MPISQELGVDGQLIGLPYRLVYKFNEPDHRRRTLMRTLLQQALMQNGLLTFRGFMLPNLAHRESELEGAANAFRRALQQVRDASLENSFVSRLEIPLIA